VITLRTIGPNDLVCADCRAEPALIELLEGDNPGRPLGKDCLDLRLRAMRASYSPRRREALSKVLRALSRPLRAV
jgi:hypothetical protein